MIAMSAYYLLLIEVAAFDDGYQHMCSSVMGRYPPRSACDRPSAVANALACAAGVHEKAGRGDL